MNDKKEVLGGFEMNQKTIDTYEMKVNRLVAEKIKLRSEIGQLKAEIEQHKLSHVIMEQHYKKENAELKEKMAEMDEERRNAWDYADALKARWENLKYNLNYEVQGTDCIHCKNVLKEMQELESGGVDGEHGGR